MKLRLALVSLCALATLSACTRDPAPAADTHAVADDTQKAADDAPPAEDTSAESAPTPCDDATDQREMTACWANASRTEEERVDAALKKVYELDAFKMIPTARQQLQDDQRRWQEFVAGHCKLYSDIYEDGSAASMTAFVCRWDMAQARLKQLILLTEEFNP